MLCVLFFFFVLNSETETRQLAFKRNYQNLVITCDWFRTCIAFLSK